MRRRTRLSLGRGVRTVEETQPSCRLGPTGSLLGTFLLSSFFLKRNHVEAGFLFQMQALSVEKPREIQGFMKKKGGWVDFFGLKTSRS